VCPMITIGLVQMVVTLDITLAILHRQRVGFSFTPFTPRRPRSDQCRSCVIARYFNGQLLDRRFQGKLHELFRKSSIIDLSLMGDVRHGRINLPLKSLEYPPILNLRERITWLGEISDGDSDSLRYRAGRTVSY